MRIYKVIVGENRFEYSFITDVRNLLEWNKILKKDHSYYPQLDSNDDHLMLTVGGTVIYRSNNEDMTYLVDIDYTTDIKLDIQAHRQTLEDPYLFDKFESLSKSIKRDMGLSKVLK